MVSTGFLPNAKAIQGMESLNLDELPVFEPEFGRTPPSSLYQPQLMSPRGFGGVKLGCNSPQSQQKLIKVLYPYGLNVAPTPSTYNQNVHACQKIASPSPPSFPPTFGGCVDFTTFAGVAPNNSAPNNQLYAPEGAPGCFVNNPYQLFCSQGPMNDNALCKDEDNDS